MFSGMHRIENIYGQNVASIRRFQQGRVVRDPKILPEPVNKSVSFHGSSQVEYQQFTVLIGKKGDEFLVAERCAVAGLQFCIVDF